ncbi:SOS response-associated peptidase [Thermaerobacillus caldiproteolyticus]|uniref:Abasic site processing protein n=1 Tax=Thermaerobacillus caldiproteolyticus TaxID=247480 RepID=A0A7V9Z719_9BACL|nr:SOS response-associated peptidase [Anoxybacillus caldiproteolyticus]MBA2875267.1 putative SOS response-associated peptidase YedK [Anoxybacillus caldiproteolyticus]QPA32792.1 SOS response-associated peptidase [Anoxybacillus caldiproteolyticus]
MCGRFSLTGNTEQLARYFHFQYVGNIEPRFNIAPSQNVLTIVENRGERVGKMMKWGLVPYWADDPKIGFKMINARAETVDEKASFKHAFKKRRCLILADGFYEWKKEGNKKIPHRFTLKSERPFAFAGLWEKWDKHGDSMYTCTIITTKANELVKEVHERMPVILPKEWEEVWLDPAIDDTEYLKSLLRPYPAEEMKMYRVSTAVNSAKNDVEECVKPINSR